MQRLTDAAWRPLQPGHPALRLELLQSHAATDRTGTALRVFLVEDDAGIVAGAVCRLPPPERPGSVPHLLYGRLASPLRRIGLLRRPVLECCAPGTPIAGWVWRPGDTASRQTAMRQLLDGMEAHARQHGLDLACVAVPAADTMLRDELRQRGYLSTPLPAVTRLDVQWQDFDGYVRWLRKRSANAAKSARAELRRNRESGVTFRRIEPGPAELQALYRLLRAHHHHKNGWEPPFGPEWLQDLARRLGPDLLLFAAEREGRRIAMMGGVRAGATVWFPWFGIELQNRQNDFTYPSLVYYHMAEVAAGMGLEHLLYGTAALAAKRARGCTITDNDLFYRPSGVWRQMLGATWFQLHRRWKARRAA